MHLTTSPSETTHVWRETHSQAPPPVVPQDTTLALDTILPLESALRASMYSARCWCLALILVCSTTLAAMLSWMDVTANASLPRDHDQLRPTAGPSLS